MPESISHELVRILARMKASGRSVVWLSEANREILRDPRGGMKVTARESVDITARAPMSSAPSSVAQGRPASSAMPAVAPLKSPGPAAPPAHPSPQPPLGSVPAMPPSAPGLPLPPAAPLDLSGVDLTELERLCTECERCGLCRTRHRVVFGQGPRDARLMFIGEGPGHDEDMQGVPFVGAAGQLLTKMIAAMGLDRFSDDPARGVYIANIVKCRPPRNRNPEKGEVDACLPYLRRQIELVKPEAIVLLGAVPLEHLMGITGITRHRGQWLSYANIPVMPTFHPALILRFSASPQMEREKKLMVWDDLKKVMALLNLPVPAPKQH